MFIWDLNTPKRKIYIHLEHEQLYQIIVTLGQSRGLLEQHAEDSWNCRLYLPKPLYIAAKLGLSVSL